MEELQQRLAALAIMVQELAEVQKTQAAQIATQSAQIATQSASSTQTIQQPTVEEYTDVSTPNVSVPRDISLDIYKTLAEFTGEREKYATWRSTASTAMRLLESYKTSTRYFEALMIVRNKITGAASNVLNNYNTAFNFDAIIDRLDFTYADKRPLHILEQEYWSCNRTGCL